MTNTNNESLQNLLKEAERLHHRYELSKTVGPDYYEPGMMEYLDQSEGFFEEETGKLRLRFEVRGTRYDGRTEQIESVNVGDPVCLNREADNLYNPNNFTFTTMKGKNIGNMPAELCNVIAPLYDEGVLTVQNATVSYVEPISKRSKHAKQAVLFIQLDATISL